ncbi:MAG TPA: hypothetical protein DD727_10050, partial [Clostridiales bacterium]|nr:hypothetical protein [Clostridiales bacterium]
TEGWGISCEIIQTSREWIQAIDSRRTLHLKILEMTPENILFVHEAKEYLAERGFTRLDRYVPTLAGLPCHPLGDVFMVMVDLPGGRESDFGDEHDLVQVSRTLARMHQSSAGFHPSPQARGMDYTGLLPLYYRKRCDEMKRHFREARKGKGRFDLEFALHGAKYCQLAEEVIDRLQTSSYRRIAGEYKQNPSLCHHDLIYRNVLLDKQGASLINFEMCCIDIRSYDLANLIRRRMRKSGWKAESIRMVVKAYLEEGELLPGELEILKLMLLFPQKLWRIVNKYYNSRRGWGEKAYLAQLSEIIREMEESVDLVESLEPGSGL